MARNRPVVSQASGYESRLVLQWDRQPEKPFEAELPGGKAMKYRVHRFNIKMTSDQSKLEQFLNSLEGEVVAIIPNVTWAPKTQVDFLLIVEKLG
jgi:hypothetical protein